MGRPRGSKNKAKDRPVVGNPIPQEQANEQSQPDTTPPSNALASPEGVAPGGAEAEGETPAPVTPKEGDAAKHPDGRTGVITVVEARGDAFAVSVRWDGDEDESQYTPTDWAEMNAALAAVAVVSPTAQTEPAPEPDEEPKPETMYGDDDEPQPPPGIGTRLAEIGHEWADTDAQLLAKESEKSTVVKQYTKQIDILESRCRQLAAEYREAEWPETFDYKRGVKHVWNGRTGRLMRTEKLGSYQAPLDFDRPSKPPAAVTVEVELANPLPCVDGPATVTLTPIDTVGEVVTEGDAESVERTPFDDPAEDDLSETTEA